MANKNLTEEDIPEWDNIAGRENSDLDDKEKQWLKIINKYLLWLR